jgi:hypothetical protein
MSQESLDVRGHTIFNKPASFPLKVVAGLIDVSAILILSVSALTLLDLAPLPKWPVALLLVSVCLIYLVPQKLWLGFTLGCRLWGLKPAQTGTTMRGLQRQMSFNPMSVFVSSLLTTLCVLISFASVKGLVFEHPIWTRATLWKMDPFMPASSDWLVTPFFYTIGGWPKVYDGHPVLYTLPYEKGPPTRFIGHVIAELESPDIRLILEGPKTPEKVKNQHELKECFLGGYNYSCLTQRESTLNRHISEIRSFSPKRWTLKWFTVDNPMLPPESQPQGIYLSAQSSSSIQDRFIVIGNNGTHQAVILHRTKNAQGDLAFDLVQKTIRSLRVFEELNSGRAWINRELQSIRLDELQGIQNKEILTAQLAEVQGFLISRISVEPSSYDSYFHLAGTSLMLTKRARHFRDGIYFSANRNLQSAYKYATDLAPSDPRTTQIQNLVLESQKN